MVRLSGNVACFERIQCIQKAGNYLKTAGLVRWPIAIPQRAQKKSPITVGNFGSYLSGAATVDSVFVSGVKFGDLLHGPPGTNPWHVEFELKG